MRIRLAVMLAILTFGCSARVQFPKAGPSKPMELPPPKIDLPDIPKPVLPNIDFFEKPDKTVDPRVRKLEEALARGRTLDTLVDIQQLHNEGVDFNSLDDDGKPVLAYAVWTGNINNINFMLDHEADPNKVGQNGGCALMELAAGNGDYSDTQRLAIFETLKAHHLDFKNDHGVRTLLYAALAGRTALVEGLVDGGVPVDGHFSESRKFEPSDDVLGVAGMLDSIFGTESKNRTALMNATLMSHIDTMQALLHRHADIEARDEFGRTALFFSFNDVDSKKYSVLVSAGADVFATDAHHMTTLIFAAEALNLEAVQDLISRGVKVDAKNDEGKTALDMLLEYEEKNGSSPATVQIKALLGPTRAML